MYRSLPSKEFKNELQMKTELLSDFRRDISRAYGVLNDEGFYSKGAYFLIDKEGRVRWSHVGRKQRPAARELRDSGRAETAELAFGGLGPDRIS